MSKWTDTLLAETEPFWRTVERCASRSVKAKAKGFLPELARSNMLGCGYWGCVFPTADKRFVVKLTLDSTEGPHVALAMDQFPLHPGIAYFHRIWKLPSRVYVGADGGNVWLYVIVREEIDVESIWTVKKVGRKKKYAPARGYKQIHDALEELPECCSCLVQSKSWHRRGMCPTNEVRDNERELEKILKRVGLKSRASKGYHAARLIADIYGSHGILLGDVHFGNVGLRRHDLSGFGSSRKGVPRHKKLVVTDLGDLGQAPRTRGQYPSIAALNPGLMERYAQAIPVIPC